MSEPASERRPVARPTTYPSVEACSHDGRAETCRRVECPYYLDVDWDRVARDADLDDIARVQLVRHGSRCSIQLASEHEGMSEGEIAALMPSDGGKAGRSSVEAVRRTAQDVVRRVRLAAPVGHDDVERLAKAAATMDRRCRACGADIATSTRASALHCPPCSRRIQRRRP